MQFFEAKQTFFMSLTRSEHVLRLPFWLWWFFVIENSEWMLYFTVCIQSNLNYLLFKWKIHAWVTKSRRLNYVDRIKKIRMHSLYSSLFSIIVNHNPFFQCFPVIRFLFPTPARIRNAFVNHSFAVNIIDYRIELKSEEKSKTIFPNHNDYGRCERDFFPNFLMVCYYALRVCY